MLAKLAIVEEEPDESTYWMELLVEAGTVPEQRLADLIQEADEITAMVVASIKTLRHRKKRRGKSTPKSQLQNPK